MRHGVSNGKAVVEKPPTPVVFPIACAGAANPHQPDKVKGPRRKHEPLLRSRLTDQPLRMLRPA
jgi:hypothetical protein